jgi:hypothetical protein
MLLSERMLGERQAADEIAVRPRRWRIAAQLRRLSVDNVEHDQNGEGDSERKNDRARNAGTLVPRKRARPRPCFPFIPIPRPPAHYESIGRPSAERNYGGLPSHRCAGV